MKKKLTLSKHNKLLFGVCGGLAEYFNIDATIIRIIWAAISAYWLGSPIFFYVICWAIIPHNEV